MSALSTAAAAAGVPTAPDYLSLESPLATSSERRQIDEMRTLIGDHVLAPYKDKEEVSGDISLLRYLRGRNHDVEDAARVFREHIAVRKKHNLDQVRASVLEASLSDSYTHLDFPNGEVCNRHMPVVFNAGSSKEGHVYCYIPIGRQDSRPIWSDVGFEKYFEFLIHEWVCRDLQLTRLSHKHGRLIKLILIIDLAGLSLTSSQVTHGAKKKFDKTWQAILETKPENTARWYFINTPWFGRKMFQALGKITFPENTLKKIELFGTDYREALAGRVDLRLLSTLIQAGGGSHCDLMGDTLGVEAKGVDRVIDKHIKAGEVKEVVFEIDPSRHKAVRWKVRALDRDIGFRVQAYSRSSEGGAGGRLGSNAVVGSALEGSDRERSGLRSTVLLPQRMIRSTDGNVTGEIPCQQSVGLLLFEFSNKHSWLRGNRVQYSLEIVRNSNKTGH